MHLGNPITMNARRHRQAVEVLAAWFRCLALRCARRAA